MHSNTLFQIKTTFFAFCFFILCAPLAEGASVDWKYRVPGFQESKSAPTVMPNNNLMITINQGTINEPNHYVLSSSDGSSDTWGGAFQGEVTESASIYDSLMSIPANYNMYLYTLTGSANGSIRLEDAQGNALHPTSSISYGISSTGYTAGRANGIDYLASIDITGRSMNWTRQLTSRVEATPIVDASGRILVGTRDGIFHCYSPAGQLAWSFTATGGIWKEAALDSDGNVIFITDAGNLYCLRPNGTLKWNYSVGGTSNTLRSPVVDSDNSVIIGATGKVYSISSTGTRNWTFSTNDAAEEFSNSATIGSDNRIYVLTDLDARGGGYLYALNANTGASEDSFQVGYAATSPISINGSKAVFPIYDYIWSVNVSAASIKSSAPWPSYLRNNQRSGTLAVDSDGDSMADGWEMAHFGNLTHTGTADGDNDNLTDRYEYEQSSNPTVADTDGDTMPDGWEAQYGLNPLVDDSSQDLDNDTFTNIQEYNGNSDPSDNTSTPSLSNLTPVHLLLLN